MSNLDPGRGSELQQIIEIAGRASSRKLFRHIGTFGGLLLGVAGSNFLSMFSTNQFSPNGVTITVIATLLGGILTAAHMMKD